MNREELPQEASREDKMRDALKHYEELATKACWHRSDIPDAIRAYYASLPPAEGAEEILEKHLNLQFKDTPEDWTVALIQFNQEKFIAAMQEFATLHAQRLAEKMVSERYEIAIKALETIHHAYYTEGESAEEQVVDLRSIALKALEEIDNLKSRESHDR